VNGPRSWVFILVGLLFRVGFIRAAQQSVPASASSRLAISGNVEKSLSLSLDDLRHSPRTTVKAMNEHQDNKEKVYEGVYELFLQSES
jgi:DMSO/TMAO reductase YedYZ molybdopterin-dependent catalytic subunit